MTQVPPGGYQANELFCSYCDCAVDLHDQDGCRCEDSNGHADTLVMIDEDECCNCERTRPEFDRHGGWSYSYANDPTRSH